MKMTVEEYNKHPVYSLFRTFIAARGLNMSHQRILVLEAFLSAGPRVSVDDLYIRLRTRYNTLGRATVYRTLKLLVECGIARVRIAEGAPLHYEKFPSADYESLLQTRHSESESSA